MIYSEATLFSKFQSFLYHNKEFKGIYSHNIVASEVDGIIGKPDFYAMNTMKLNYHLSRNNVFTLNESRILGVLSKKKYLDIESLPQQFHECDRSVMLRALNNLLTLDIVISTKRGYTISRRFDINSLELGAFELKISNFKKLRQQALQARTYCDYVYVVLPLIRLKQAEIDFYSDWGIGVIEYTGGYANFKIRKKAKRSKPINLAYKINAVSTLGRWDAGNQILICMT